MTRPSPNSIAEQIAMLTGLVLVSPRLITTSPDWLFATGIVIVWFGILAGTVSSATEIEGRARYLYFLFSMILGVLFIWIGRTTICDYVETGWGMIGVLASAATTYFFVYFFVRGIIRNRATNPRTDA